MNLGSVRRAGGRRGAGGGAFTIVEMLVVIAIIVILLLIAVPAFQSMIASSEASLADASLRSALKGGRDAAVQGGPGNDAAVALFFEPGGRTRMVTCVRAATVRQPARDGRRAEVEIFTPVPGAAPVQLPRGWMVRAPASLIGSWWYDSGVGDSSRYAFGATTAGTVISPVNWVFPETGFYDQELAGEGLKRSTFIVRFEGGTGLLKSSPASDVFIVDPRPSNLARDSSLARLNPTQEPWSTDLSRWARTVAGGVLSDSGGAQYLTPTQVASLAGRNSSDIVLARPVGVLALYDETKLAAALGARLDRETESLYVSPLDPDNSPPGPRLVQNATADRINQWIGGDTNFDDSRTVGTGDFPEAKLFAIDRFTGALRPLTVQREVNP